MLEFCLHEYTYIDSHCLQYLETYEIMLDTCKLASNYVRILCCWNFEFLNQQSREQQRTELLFTVYEQISLSTCLCDTLSDVVNLYYACLLLSDSCLKYF